MVLTSAPLLLQALRYFILVVNFVDRYALIRKMLHLVIEVRVGISLSAQYFLDSLVAPTWPVV